VVVKRGADGALASRAGEAVVRIPAMPVDPIDTTGAGDSFNAGFLRSWLDGGSIAASLEFAAVCGAISTRSVGGVDGQPTFAEATAAVEAWRSIRGRSQ
jgi:sugar/nucleoside kinase (ribokinase family)